MALSPLGTLTNPGENNGGGDFIELFLEKYAGEVSEAYKEELILLPRSRVRTLKGAKSAQFPATGNLTADYHLRGERYDDDGQLSEMVVGERLIHLDRPVFNATFVDEWEEMVNHFDVRGPIATGQGHALAKHTETNLFRLLVQGATKTGPMTDHPTGNVITSAAAATSGADLVEAIEDMVQYWDENDVPQEGRYAAFRPAQYRLLTEQTEFHNVEIGNGGNGSRKMGTIGMVSGVEILKSNLVPSTNFTTIPAYATNGMVNDYRADATNGIGVFGTSRALGVVQLQGVEIAAIPHQMLDGTIFKAKKAIGAGVLRESDCGFLQTA